VSKSKESRASLRMREQARRSRTSAERPIITPISRKQFSEFKDHLISLSESQPVELNLFSIAELFDASLDQGLAFTAKEWMGNVARGTTMPASAPIPTWWPRQVSTPCRRTRLTSQSARSGKDPN
jgi:hypothetical protein